VRWQKRIHIQGELMGRITVEQENKIIATVSYIHHQLGFKSPPFTFTRFFEMFPGYKVIGSRLPTGYDGELLLRGTEKIIRFRLTAREPTARFTIAHEIAHSFLHRNKEHRCQIHRRFRIYEPPALNPKEMEADYFALEMMVPLPMLSRMVPASELKKLGPEKLGALSSELAKVFGINTTTMQSRLKDLLRFRRCDEAEWL